MKKISFIALLFVAFVCLNSCESDILRHGTPSEDNTKLWPAKTDTSDLWGYINEKGEMVIPAQFKKAYQFSCGRAKVVFDNDCQAFIDGDKRIRYIVPEGEKCDDYFYLLFYIFLSFFIQRISSAILDIIIFSNINFIFFNPIFII